MGFLKFVSYNATLETKKNLLFLMSLPISSCFLNCKCTSILSNVGCIDYAIVQNTTEEFTWD